MCIGFAHKVAEDFDDEDEFVSQESVPDLSNRKTIDLDKNPKGATSAELDQAIVWDAVDTRPLYEKYFMEICFLFFFLTYGFNFWTGKKKNDVLAIGWIKMHKAFFDGEFSHVGFEENTGEGHLQQISYSQYHLYVSGRANIQYAFFDLNLKKRQDLFNVVMSLFLWKDNDKVIIEIPLQMTKKVGFVFAIARTKEIKQVQKNFDDLKSFTSIREKKGLPSSLSILAEHDELVDQVLRNVIMETIIDEYDLIDFIHISDQKAYSHHEMFMRLELYIPDTVARMKGLLRLTIALFGMADFISNHIELSANARAKTEKSREVIEKQKKRETEDQKKEEIQKKKIDKIKLKEEERKNSNLSKDQQKKIEEKEHKKNMKKKTQKLTKLIKF